VQAQEPLTLIPTDRMMDKLAIVVLMDTVRARGGAGGDNGNGGSVTGTNVRGTGRGAFFLMDYSVTATSSQGNLF